MRYKDRHKVPTGSAQVKEDSSNKEIINLPQTSSLQCYIPDNNKTVPDVLVERLWPQNSYIQAMERHSDI